MSSRLMDFPLAMRSLRRFPPLPLAVMGVLAEQLKTGLAGVEMDEALNTTHHGIKYMTGDSRIMACWSLGRSLRRETCPLENSLFIALMMSAFVSSSWWYRLTCLSKTLLASR